MKQETKDIIAKLTALSLTGLILILLAFYDYFMGYIAKLFLPLMIIICVVLLKQRD